MYVLCDLREQIGNLWNKKRIMHCWKICLFNRKPSLWWKLGKGPPFSFLSILYRLYTIYYIRIYTYTHVYILYTYFDMLEMYSICFNLWYLWIIWTGNSYYNKVLTFFKVLTNTVKWQYIFIFSNKLKICYLHSKQPRSLEARLSQGVWLRAKAEDMIEKKHTWNWT